MVSQGAPLFKLRQSLESGALEGGESTPHSPKDILVETSTISLRRVDKDGNALGPLPDLEADCQRKALSFNSQETFLVYSEDTGDNFPVNSTLVRNPEIDLSTSFQNFLETEIVLS